MYNRQKCFKIRKDKQQANTTVQQSTYVPLSKHYAHGVWDDKEGIMLEFKHFLNHKNIETQKAWGTSGANEYGRLMQVIGKSRNLKDQIKGIKSTKFIKKQQLQKHKTVTYARFVADIRPQKY